MNGFVRSVVEPLAQALAFAAGRPRTLPPSLKLGRERLVEQALSEGPTVLNDAQRNLLLSDPDTLSLLHERLWSAPVAARDWNIPVPA